MYLGKPVIATDWSATAEYMDRNNGFPVRCGLVTLTENHGPYTKGSVWAEPDVGHAAEQMQVVGDGERGLAQGRGGPKDHRGALLARHDRGPLPKAPRGDCRYLGPQPRCVPALGPTAAVPRAAARSGETRGSTQSSDSERPRGQ